jgi:hypothetical protein
MGTPAHAPSRQGLQDGMLPPAMRKQSNTESLVAIKPCPCASQPAGEESSLAMPHQAFFDTDDTGHQKRIDYIEYQHTYKKKMHKHHKL